MSLTALKKGFTLAEILIVLVIMGLGFMTIAPKLAERTILSDSSVVFFNKIIKNNLKTASDLGKQVFITGQKGSPEVTLYDGKTADIPAGSVSSALVNEEPTDGSSYRIYFYPDGVFDQFELKISDGSTIEGIPALHQAVHR